MESRKRKAPIELYRRVRVRKEDAEASDDEWDGVSSEADDQEQGDMEDSDEEGDDESEASPEAGSPEPEVDASTISFGALARAQASMPRPEKRRTGGPDPAASDPPDGQGVLRGRRGDGGAQPKAKVKHEDAAARKKSKHAPEEVTSKRQVSRYREVVSRPADARPKPRDPRFDHELSTSQDLARFRRNYAFLDEYREAELRQLREALAAGTTKAGVGSGKRKKRRGGGDKVLSPEEREELKRAIAAMESQKRARERKAREEELIAEHRRREKELVKQGKKPFYLKRSERKKMLLLDQYAGMSKGQVDKAIERKRKKVAAKEKKLLPLARRAAE